ncbi:ABC-2 transporter permease [Ectobacillus polymachus]|uniref:ABC-2 transporter permease n=1 Tax=Ectobacillus polymachus TaxID=1508806 RepID=UPI003A8C7BED
MLHLIIKDMYTQRKIAYVAPIFLLPYFLTMGKNIPSTGIYASIIYSLAIAFIAYFMALYSNFNTNEGENVQSRLILSLPIKRKTVIHAKYIMVSVWWLLSFLSSFLLLIILRVVFHIEGIQILNIRIVMFSLCFTYILTGVFYPIHFRFGYRVGTFLGIAMFFAISSGLGKLLSLNKDTTIVSGLLERPTVSLVVITFIFVLVSYFISVSVFEKKDF